MLQTKEYLIPDYYAEFFCKGPDCRHTCCNGWHITISMAEYYRLLGIPCSKKLRRLLDTAFRPVDKPTKECYAHIIPQGDAGCPLHREDGYCALQKECGEELLPAVCRYYPRSPKHTYGCRCCCSNSCEKVVEILFEKESKMAFCIKPLTFSMPSFSRHAGAISEERFSNVQHQCIALLQERSLPFYQRMVNVGYYLQQLHIDIQDASDSWKPHPFPSRTILPDELGFILKTQHHVVDWFEHNSRNVLDFCASAQRYYGIDGLAELNETAAQEATRQYEKARQHFNTLFPSWERMFEQILVNHILYEQFPYCETYKTPWDAFIAFCAVYSFIRFIALGYMATRNSKKECVDLLASLFRLIDHSNYDHNAIVLLKKESCMNPEKLFSLLKI